MMKKLRCIVFLLCLGSVYCRAQFAVWEQASQQEIIKVYQNACNWLVNTQSYFFKLKYLSYKDYQSKEPLESSEAYYKRVSANYISEAMGVKTVQNSRVKFVVDTANKSVTVMSPSSLSLTIASGEEMEEMLSNTRALKKIKVSKTLLRYHIDFNKNSLYEAFEFTVNDKGMLDRITYFYSEQENNETEYGQQQQQASSSTEVKPRLEILFYDYQVPTKYLKSEFEDSFIVANEKNKIYLVGAYKNYRLLDYRLQSEK